MFYYILFIGLISTSNFTYGLDSDKCYDDMSIDYSIRYNIPVVGYEMGEPVVFDASVIPYKKENDDWFLLEREAAQNFNQMAAALKEKGYNVTVNSAFRTKKEQRKMRREYGDMAAKVGWSNHQSGTAVDLGGTMAFVSRSRINAKHFSSRCYRRKVGRKEGYMCPTRMFWWLRKNAPKFGFYNTVENEPWHWDYLGAKVGTKLVRK